MDQTLLDPVNILPRPTTSRSQDVSHILAKKFGDLFLRESVDPNIIDNLRVSQGSNDPYHELYVKQLLQITAERQKRLDVCNRLERSLMQARARAMSADERQLHKARADLPDATAKLPPLRSHLRACLDNDLLRANGLLAPDDLTVTAAGQQQQALLASTVGGGSKGPGLESPSHLRSTASLRSYSTRAASATRSGTSDSGLVKPRRQSLDDLDLCDPDCFIAEAGEEERDPGAAIAGKRWATSRCAMSTREMRLRRLEAGRNRRWQENMTGSAREGDRRELDCLQAKVNYMKNPRHLNPLSSGTGCRSLLVTATPAQTAPATTADIFLPSPAEVRFAEYEIGQVYELKLTLKNVTSVLRSVRLLPPKTEYFSLGLGQFPGEGGLVAPGMSCQYTIRFSPDSLGDYADEIVVESQAPRPLIVRVLGCRPRPLLTVPQVWEMGHCLVFGTKVVRFEIKNKGGSGRFVILPKRAWPASNFKSAVNTGTFVSAPFAIHPNCFELGPRESYHLELMFMPMTLGRFDTEFLIVCDNCHLHNFTIAGTAEVASVELQSIEGGLATPLAGELCDVTAQYLCRFSNLHPFMLAQKSVVLSNKCHVDLSYSWKVVKPHCRQAPLGDNEDGAKNVVNETGQVVRRAEAAPRNRLLDMDSAFVIQPPSGIIRADAAEEFKLSFAPNQVGNWHSVLHLVLQNIPDIPPDSGLSSDGSETSSPVDVVLHDITSVELEVKGVCMPLDVLIEPLAVAIPGRILISTTVRRQVKVTNLSSCPISFCWETSNDTTASDEANDVTSEGAGIVEVEPRMATLPSKQAGFVDICVTGTRAGMMGRLLLCHVDNLDSPIGVQLQAAFKGPELTIDQPDVDLGLVRVGQSTYSSVWLSNKNPIPCSWSVHVCSPDDLEVFEELRLVPDLQTLAPLSESEIHLEYNPRRAKHLNCVVEFRVEKGAPSYLKLSATVQSPTVCLLHSQLLLDHLYLNIETGHVVQMFNQSELEADFQWDEARGYDACKVRVRIEPPSGRLKPREQVELKVWITPLQLMEVNQLWLPCRVTGMTDPVVLKLSGCVRGLIVSYHSPDDGMRAPLSQNVDGCTRQDEEVELDFGDSVPLWTVVKRRLVIRNETGIPAEFQLCMDYFPAHDYEVEVGAVAELGCGSPSNSSLTCSSRARGHILKKTPNLADPNSKPPKLAHYDWCKQFLAEKKGAAFLPKPSSGILCAHAEQVIEVTAVADMWGDYQDVLICQVGDLPPSRIPVRFGVAGCPVEFTMTAGRPDHRPVIRFGSRTWGSGPVTRPIRLNNKSPFELRLDWELYQFHPEDDQLLDLCIAYGEAFPRLDSLGIDLSPDQSPESLTDREGLPSSTRDATQPKVISLVVRPHEGRPMPLPPTPSPFSLSPRQLVIAPESFGILQATLHPTAVTGAATYVSYTLGFLSVDETRARVEGRVGRRAGYEVHQLRLDMTARIEAPSLTVEYLDSESDDPGFSYDLPFSSLLQGRRSWPAEGGSTFQLPPSGVIHRLSAQLRSAREAVVAFNVHAQEPFCLLEPASQHGEDGVTKSENITLEPRQPFKVVLGFRLSPSMLRDIQNPNLHSDIELPQPDTQSLRWSRVGLERQLHFRDAVTVRFPSSENIGEEGNSQLLPARTRVIFPNLQLSRDHLDFATCLVGQRREIQISLHNPTRSASLWLAEMTSQDDSSPFTLTPTSGFLEAGLTQLSETKVFLSVFFTPRQVMEYEAVFTFRGVLGEEPQELRVTGRGSQDGQYEDVYNN